MTTYVVLLPGDESVWENATEEHRSAVYARHGEFSRTLEEHGHKVTGGAELAHSREAKVVRRTASGVAVTDGPYAETVEQLGGYYVVDTDDLDDLLEVCAILADEDGAVEVRAALGDEGGGVVRFVLLMAEEDHFERWDAADEALRQRVVADFQAFDAAVGERGSVVGGDALSRPSSARTVRPGAGRPVTDGPFAETVEQIGGFYVIDVESLEVAVELAALLPREYTVEVRPVLEVAI